MAHQRLAARGALRLGQFLVVARADALIAAHLLGVHEVAEPLAPVVLHLQVVRLVPNQREIVMILIRIFDTELARAIHAAVDHLRVVVVPLRLYLVAHAFLKDVVVLCADPLRVLDRCHHIWVVTALKLFQLLLPGGHDGLVRVRRAYIVVLEALGARDPVGTIGDHLLGGHVLAGQLLTADKLAILLLQHNLLIIRGFTIIASIGLLFLAIVKRNLDTPICVSF